MDGGFRTSGQKLLKFINHLRNEGPKSALCLTCNYITPNESVKRKVMKYTSCQLPDNIPDSAFIHHPTGIIVNPDSEFGDDVELFQNVTIGRGSDGVPQIKDGVVVYASAVIIGDVVVGENSVVGANATVVDDVPPNSIVAGTPAEVIEELEDVNGLINAEIRL